MARLAPGESVLIHAGAIIDPVGGAVRTHSIDLLAPAGRLILAGNASGEWGHQLDSNRLWYGGLTVSGFNAGS